MVAPNVLVRFESKIMIIGIVKRQPNRAKKSLFMGLEDSVGLTGF